MLVNRSYQEDVSRWVAETKTRLGHSEMNIRVEWSTRLTNAMGKAFCPRVLGMPQRIKLSTQIWPRASHEERRQTTIHEVCHIIAYHEALLNNIRINPHGYEWEVLMRRCGVPPERCHEVNLLGIGNRTHVAKCACSEHAITTRIANAIRNGSSRHCSRCKTTLTLDGSPPETKIARSYEENLAEYIEQLNSR